MTLAAIRKMTSRLTRAQKIKLAGELLEETTPRLRPPLSLEEIERRAEEARSGKVKLVSAAESRKRIDQVMAKIKRQRQTRDCQ